MLPKSFGPVNEAALTHHLGPSAGRNIVAFGGKSFEVLDSAVPYHGRRNALCDFLTAADLLQNFMDEAAPEMIGVQPSSTSPRLSCHATLPHIGWNQVERTRDHPLFDGIAPNANFYFVHSYAGMPEGAATTDLTLAETEYGGRFVSAAARGRMAGVQFHPERSGRDGLRLLGNFVELVRASEPALAAAGAR